MQVQGGVGARLPGELQGHLVDVVVVDVAVTAGPHELADLQARLLGEHVGEDGVGRDVERNAEEHVRTALVELAGEFPVGDVELEQEVARRQGHVLQLRDVPGGDDVAS